MAEDYHSLEVLLNDPIIKRNSGIKEVVENLSNNIKNQYKNIQRLPFCDQDKMMELKNKIFDDRSNDGKGSNMLNAKTEQLEKNRTLKNSKS